MNSSLETEGIVPTLNKRGYTARELDEYGNFFLAYIQQFSTFSVLDIGAGHGVATHQALLKGAHVVATDMEPLHLDILKQKTPESLLSHLTLEVGKFPQDLSFSSYSFDVIVMFQVLHFLTSEEIEQGMPLLFNWLKPQGKIFLTAISPYMGVLKDFFPIYQKRKEENIPWPGQIENIKDYCRHPCTEVNPDFIHVFDTEVVSKIFQDAGFKIEKVGYYPIHPVAERDFKNDGRECVGIIASKAE